MKNLLFFTLTLLVLSGCATNMREQFDKVKVGMEKDDVLNLMDSPQRTQRWHGMDRWTYIFYTDQQRYEKEVHFLEGKANYVGEVYKPEISAEEQDAINDKSNLEVETLAQAHRAEVQKSYFEYEQQSKGEDAVRYVPQFEPVK